MKNLIAAILASGCICSICICKVLARQSNAECRSLTDAPLVITLEGIEDGNTANINTSEFLSETE